MKIPLLDMTQGNPIRLYHLGGHLEGGHGLEGLVQTGPGI